MKQTQVTFGEHLKQSWQNVPAEEKPGLKTLFAIAALVFVVGIGIRLANLVF